MSVYQVIPPRLSAGALTGYRPAPPSPCSGLYGRFAPVPGLIAPDPSRGALPPVPLIPSPPTTLELATARLRSLPLAYTLDHGASPQGSPLMPGRLAYKCSTAGPHGGSPAVTGGAVDRVAGRVLWSRCVPVGSPLWGVPADSHKNARLPVRLKGVPLLYRWVLPCDPSRPRRPRWGLRGGAWLIWGLCVVWRPGCLSHLISFLWSRNIGFQNTRYRLAQPTSDRKGDTEQPGGCPCGQPPAALYRLACTLKTKYTWSQERK